MLKICVRWSPSTKTTVHSISVYNDNTTAPQYDLRVYQDSNTQLGVGSSFVQQYLLMARITSTSTKAAIWVHHNKGSDCVIEANWSGAVHIH